MQNATFFKNKLEKGKICLGTSITFSDACLTEVLCPALDFVWIDMEHNALSLEVVQAHIMATKGTQTTALVRVTWNDPALIKPVLDIGADGIIVPMIRTSEDVRRAVAACRYPPEGIRGFGPRRASAYGRLGGPEFCREANQTVISIVQIEHIQAVENLDKILTVEGLTSIVIGSNDLAGSMGHMGEPCHPAVLQVIDTILAKTKQAKMPVGIAIGTDATQLMKWTDKGVQWLSAGADFMLLVGAADALFEKIRSHIPSTLTATEG